MAYIECKLKSQRLLTTVGVKIYLPCDLPVEVGNKVKVISAYSDFEGCSPCSTASPTAATTGCR